MIANGDLATGTPLVYLRGVFADERYVIGFEAVRVIPQRRRGRPTPRINATVGRRLLGGDTIGNARPYVIL